MNVLAVLAFQSSIYHLWAARNSRLHSQLKHPVVAAAELIKQDIRERICSMSRLKTNCMRANVGMHLISLVMNSWEVDVIFG